MAVVCKPSNTGLLKKFQDYGTRSIVGLSLCLIIILFYSTCCGVSGNSNAVVPKDGEISVTIKNEGNTITMKGQGDINFNKVNAGNNKNGKIKLANTENEIRMEAASKGNININLVKTLNEPGISRSDDKNELQAKGSPHGSLSVDIQNKKNTISSESDNGNINVNVINGKNADQEEQYNSEEEERDEKKRVERTGLSEL